MASKKSKKVWTEIIVAVLVAALIGTGTLSSMSAITIERSEDKSEAAVNYLVDSSDYVKENKAERMADVLSTVGGEKTLEDYYTLAATQIASEDYREASESIAKCLEMHGDTKDALYLDLLMKQGCIYVMLEKYDSALKYLDMALEADPNSTDAYLIEAQIYSQKGDMASLSSSLEKYLALKPNDDEIRKLLAQTKFLQADYKAATAEYAKILQNENDPQILYLNGLTEIQLGDFANAEKQLTEAIGQNDTYDGIYYYRGVCRMANEAYADAIADFSASIGKNSMTQTSYYTRGVCSLMTENYNYDSVVSDLTAAASGSAADVAKQAQDLLQKLKDATDAAQAAQAAKAQIENTNGTTGGAVTSGEAIQ
jgi:tetratricopeptide (TPR) repeat protein